MPSHRCPEGSGGPVEVRLAHGWRFKHQRSKRLGHVAVGSFATDISAPVPINVCFSNRPSGSSTFRLSAAAVSMSLTGSRFFRNRRQGPSIMGFEDEVEQSLQRPCRQTSYRNVALVQLPTTGPTSRTWWEALAPAFLMPGLTIWQRGSYLARSDCVIFQAGSHRARRPECRAHRWRLDRRAGTDHGAAQLTTPTFPKKPRTRSLAKSRCPCAIRRISWMALIGSESLPLN